MAALASTHQLPRKWKERDGIASPDPLKLCSQPQPPTPSHLQTRVVVPVVYYLSRNGHLEHPHFIEVPLSYPHHALFLSDVINRLNLLRGKAMASQYSWSSKRSYKNGYVWHDLDENDFIHPVHGCEYVLKGSHIPLQTTLSSISPQTPSSSSSKNTPGETDSPAMVRTRRRNQSWGAIEYKTEPTREFPGKAAAADASTQTDDKRRRRTKEKGEDQNVEQQIQMSTELSRDEISPPPSDSSPETLESLVKADGRIVVASSLSSSSITTTNQPHQSPENNRTAGNCPSGKLKASSVLMSLISCGSISFRDCGAAAVKDHGFSLISHHHNKMKLPRGENQSDVMMEIENDASSSFAKMALEDKECFSGSLIETRQDHFPSLIRSSSCNADRSSHLKGAEKGEDEVRAKCIPRRGKTQTGGTKKECESQTTGHTINHNHAQDGNKNEVPHY